MATGLRERWRVKARRTIQERALDLFDERGFDAVTIEEIAAAAEVSPSSVYRYFGTKEGLIVADEFDTMSQQALEELLDVNDPVGSMIRIVRAYEQVEPATNGLEGGSPEPAPGNQAPAQPGDQMPASPGDPAAPGDRAPALLGDQVAPGGRAPAPLGDHVPDLSDDQVPAVAGGDRRQVGRAEPVSYRRVRYFFKEPSVRTAFLASLDRASQRIAPLMISGQLTPTQARVAANALVFGYFSALEQWYQEYGVRPIADYVEQGLAPLRPIWSTPAESTPTESTPA
ncbi:TetR/AcrR family transcriptional regulator [Kribbella solani]|uniref:TetR/AcrR family transcriptional regulator n=1 Tax=Kribbella solani TaxID=236067 RepID=UPI0029A6F418|nr:TetR family transcriptional regulator [Kribbella solani]MDX2970005.1 TetR family transcriptional regulator [Kribbella solani]